MWISSPSPSSPRPELSVPSQEASLESSLRAVLRQGLEAPQRKQWTEQEKNVGERDRLLIDAMGSVNTVSQSLDLCHSSATGLCPGSYTQLRVSHSVKMKLRLLALLTVSCAVQKLLGFTRCHLLTVDLRA